MPSMVRKPRSLPCSTMLGEFTPSTGTGNAYDSRYPSNSNENEALYELKINIQKPPSPHHSLKPWRHRPASCLNPLMQRQNTISSDNPTLSKESSQASATSSSGKYPLFSNTVMLIHHSDGRMSSVSLCHDTLGSKFSHSITLTARVPTTSPISVSDISTLASSLASSSIGGGQSSATQPGNTPPSLPVATGPISGADTTSLTRVQPPLSQTSSLLGGFSLSLTQPKTFFATSVTSQPVRELDLPSITGGSSKTSLPTSPTIVHTISERPSTLTGLSTVLSVIGTTLSTANPDSTSNSNSYTSTVMNSPPSNTSPMMVSTSTTSGSSPHETSTTLDPTSTLTSDSTSLSVIASTTSIAITTFNISTSAAESSAHPIPSSSEDYQPSSPYPDVTTSFSMTLQLPPSRSTPASISSTSIPCLSASTCTTNQTIAHENGPTITYTTIIQSGVLNSDNPRPNDNAFAHNTGGIIGVAVSAALVVIVIVVVMFLSCQRYRSRRERVSGNILAGDSRESLERELGLDPDFPSQPAIMGLDRYVTMQQRAYPGSTPYNLSPHDGRGGGSGSGENLSSESAGMYPIQSFASPPIGGMDVYASAPTLIPATSGVSNSNTAHLYGISPSDNVTHQPLVRSPTMGSPTRMAFSPSYVLPNENAPQVMSGAGNASDSDQCDDYHWGAVSSVSGHGHYSVDGHVSACPGSSSHGHTVNHFGVLTSSSGHAMSMCTGGVLTSSSEHGLGTGFDITDPSRRSKSGSSFAKKWGQAPPSSYVPPRRETGGSTESSGSTSSSFTSLLGKFKSIPRRKSRRKEERNERLRQQVENIRASMAQISRESVTMSMGHGSTIEHTIIYQPPSSLLNPPNPPIPIVPPPISIIQYPDMVAEPRIPFAQRANYPYFPPLPPHNPRYSIGVAISDPPYFDTWPPQASPSVPSLVPTHTDASSYVEGLLNPNILPNPSGGPRIPGADRTGGSGPNDKAVDANVRYGLWTDEYEGRSTMTLGDHVDYSRPICGAVGATEMTGSTPTLGTGLEVMDVA